MAMTCSLARHAARPLRASPVSRGPGGARRRDAGSAARRPLRNDRITATVRRSANPFEVAVPVSTVTEVDEKQEFKRLMEEAGVRSQVRLASGARGRGLFATGPVGWGESAVLLSVPLDVCIVAPFGDADPLAAEFGTAGTNKDTLVILRRAWETRNKAKIPEAIVHLLDSAASADRELGVVLWLLWAIRSGGDIWRAYADWLPQPGDMPNLILADAKELDQLQDPELAESARALQAAVADFHARLPEVNARATEMKGAPAPDVTLDQLKWGFALVASRAVATRVGETGGGDAAIMVPFFDMANHDDTNYVTAIKSVRGTEDSDVEGGIRVGLEKAINQGVGGPRMVMETTRAMANSDAEVVISYDPKAANAELMLRYGFSLRGNRNERLSRPEGAASCAPGPMKAALEMKGVMAEGMRPDEQRRVIVAVGSACGGFGDAADEDDWELTDDDVAAEMAAANVLAGHWEGELRKFETTLSEDEALLTAARGGNLPGSTPNVTSAVEYRAERKRALAAAVRAMKAYVEWLGEDDDAGEEEGGSASGFVDQE